jgi:hypothetical protein
MEVISMKARAMFYLLIALITLWAVSCKGGSDGPFTRFTGMVYDSEGKPISDMAVLVNGANTGITSDGEGVFTLDPGNFSAGVNSPNRISIGNGGVVIASREIVPLETHNFVFQFPKADGPTGSVTGSTFDDFSTQPLDGVQITLFNPELGLFRTESGQDGTFYFQGVPVGGYRLTAHKEGYNVGIAMLEVTANNETYQGIALQPKNKPHFQEGILVKGTIIDSKTGWGIEGANVTMTVETGYFGLPEPWSGNDGEPTPGDPVPLAEPNSPDYMSPPVRYDPQYQETTTQTDGYFEFAEPAIGYSIFLSFWKDGYLSGNYYMDILDLDEDVVLELELTPLVMTSAHGKLIDDIGQPIKNAWVEFIFAGIEIPIYPGGGPTTGMPNDPTWDGYKDAVGENEGSGGSAPQPPPSFGGDNPDQNDPLDNPMMQRYRWEHQNEREGASMGDEPFSGYYSTTTNDNGEFSFDTLPVGAYYVFASAYKHLSVSTDIKTVEDPVANYFEFTLERIPVGSVIGVVKDEKGLVVANALVNCVQPYIDPFAYTNENGEFRIDNVPAGNWIVSAFKYGYITDSQDASIGEDQVVTLNLVITSYTPPQVTTVHFTGRVIDGITGAGVEGARMIFTTTDNQFFFDSTSYADGFYSAELIPTEYNVLIQHPDYQDLYIGFYVDSLYPEFDFSLWSISGGTGPWGGIVPGGRGWEDGGGGQTGEAPSSGGGDTPPPEPFDPNGVFENRR